MSKDFWVELGWEGQRLYLPEYTKKFREVEKILSEFIESQGFSECLFPKLPTIAQNKELKSALPRLSEEWSTEQIDAKALSSNTEYPKGFTLAHWQCEPFYYYLKQNKPTRTVKLFDKSGWSYRVENDLNDYRLFEFQRIENVFFAEKAEAEQILIDLIRGINQVLLSLGLDTKVVEKFDEEQSTLEKTVFDIEIEIPQYGILELAGSHLHGSLFIDNLSMEIPEGFYSGCCGIGLSRIVNCLLLNNKDHNKY